MTDIRIESWSHLQEELFRDSWNPGISRFRSPCVFRGLSDQAYRLETTLMRLGGPYRDLEPHLLRNFRKYAQSESGELGSFWHMLATAQHHGLPTRLLDWTYSPYVALHFATAGPHNFHLDGAIWIVDYGRAHELLPEALRRLLRHEGAQAFTEELLATLHSGLPTAVQSHESSFHKAIETLRIFDTLGAEEEFLLFFEPPSIDDRIVNQYALFSILPNSQRRVDEWLERHPDLYRRLIIPAALKWEIRDKLDQCNITERVLFPGLDGLSSWLRRHYSPKL
jgi:hypothetical protein